MAAFPIVDSIPYVIFTDCSIFQYYPYLVSDKVVFVFECLLIWPRLAHSRDYGFPRQTLSNTMTCALLFLWKHQELAADGTLQPTYILVLTGDQSLNIDPNAISNPFLLPSTVKMLDPLPLASRFRDLQCR